jgi:hypothetical protein
MLEKIQGPNESQTQLGKMAGWKDGRMEGWKFPAVA